jgi:RNA polymerase sigma factor (sigma-70 family)
LTEKNRLSTDWHLALAQHDCWPRTVAFARLRNSDSVDEVMQNVALAVLKPDHKSIPADGVAPWLYRIVVRQCLLLRRQWGRRTRLQQQYAESAGSKVAIETQDALHWLLAGERQTLVRQALAMLSARDSEVLLLKYTQQWSYGQIAKHLGVSVSAVEGRLHRARRRLRSELATLNYREATT